MTASLALVHVPSDCLWVEWAERPRLKALGDVLVTPIEPAMSGERAGVLINSGASGRAGMIRSFWSMADGSARYALLIAEFDLNCSIRDAGTIAGLFCGEPAGVCAPHDPVYDAFLSHVRFRLDPAWIDHYTSANLSIDQQSAIVAAALGATVFIVPMLFALFLLMSANGGAHQRIVN